MLTAFYLDPERSQETKRKNLNGYASREFELCRVQWFAFELHSYLILRDFLFVHYSLSIRQSNIVHSFLDLHTDAQHFLLCDDIAIEGEQPIRAENIFVRQPYI